MNNLWQTFLSATYNVKLTSTQQKAAPSTGFAADGALTHFQHPFNHLPIAYLLLRSTPSVLFYWLAAIFSLWIQARWGKNEQGYYYVSEKSLKGYMTLNRVIFPGPSKLLGDILLSVTKWLHRV